MNAPPYPKRVFVTGATGALGRPTVRLLVAAGHEVRGLARSRINEEVIHGLGATPVRGSLFDEGSLHEAMRGCDAVLHLATHIPSLGRMRQAAAWAENDRIRSEGTQRLLRAARAAEATTFIFPGVTLSYADHGADWIEAGARVEATDPIRSALEAEAAVGQFAAEGRRGIVLRMGTFHAADAPQTLAALRLARWGISLLVGREEAYASHIFVADAAAAVVAALERAPAGTFDVVDDEPLTRAACRQALARAVGRRMLIALPQTLARWAYGGLALLAARSQRVTNRRLVEATGWKPAVPSLAQGIQACVLSGRSRILGLAPWPSPYAR